MKEIALVISCEHAVNKVPEAYKMLFAPYQALLKTHRAMDFGALTLARAFSKDFGCFLVQAKASRLLIDCNRSLSHRQCFSEVTSPLSQEDKDKLIQQYYLPFRQRVQNHIKSHLQEGKQVLHLSTHSFTPVFNGCERQTDLGLLYDPKRSHEKLLAGRWQQALKEANTKLQVRMNYPYLGISDGFTTALRQQFADEEYMGIEVELNQRLIKNKSFFYYLSKLLPQTLQSLTRILNSGFLGIK